MNDATAITRKTKKQILASIAKSPARAAKTEHSGSDCNQKKRDGPIEHRCALSLFSIPRRRGPVMGISPLASALPR